MKVVEIQKALVVQGETGKRSVLLESSVTSFNEKVEPVWRCTRCQYVIPTSGQLHEHNCTIERFSLFEAMEDVTMSLFLRVTA